MALKKLSGKPFSNIRTWLFERTKIITPNPLNPAIKKKAIMKEANFTHLQKILRETHGPTGLINKIVDVVNDLTIRVTKLETRMDLAEADIKKNIADIKVLANRVTNIENRSTRYRGQNDANINTIKAKHSADIVALKAQLTALQASKSILGHMHPPNAGGPVLPSLLKTGGRLTKPVPTSHEDYKQRLIKEIVGLENIQ